MIIPKHSVGLDALVPQPSVEKLPSASLVDVVVVQVLADGTLRINQEPVTFDRLSSRLEAVFKLRAARVAFIRGDAPVEFGVVARVIDVMHISGIASVGLLTPDLERAL
jgi:biopolymer transport protein ExbD